MPKEDPVNRYVAQRLRQIRLHKRISLRDAASRAGIKLSSYHALEAGQMRIHVDQLFRMQCTIRACSQEFWPMQPKAAPSERADDYVRRAIRESGPPAPQPVAPLEIVNAVGRVCLVNFSELVGREKTERLRIARYVTLLVCDEFQHISTRQLARVLRRAAPTLHKGRKRARRLARTDLNLRESVKEALRLLEQERRR